MKKTTGSKMILVGGILEVLIVIFGVVVAALLLSSVSDVLPQKLQVSPEDRVTAIYGFCGMIAVHLIAVIIAFVCQSKTKRYKPALVIGILLILFTNLMMNWSNISIIQVFLSMESKVF